jgi:hypothetical protein
MYENNENPVAPVQQTPAPALDLLQSLLKLLDTYIENKVAEAVTKHLNTVGNLVDMVREQSKEVAEEVLREHLDEFDHNDLDDLDNKIDSALDDHDFEDAIREVLREADIRINI